DAFYITMRKGAEMAAKAVGCELLFQGGPEFNPTVQVPVLQAVIARKPGAILIAPTDKQQLIAPLQQAADAGIPVITVDTFIDDGKYQDGSGPGDFPLSYIATDNILGGFLGGVALARAIGERGKVYVSNVNPGISTTDQREEGFKLAMRAYPNITVLDTQFNDNDANKASAQVQAVFARNDDLAGVFGANLFSAIGADGTVDDFDPAQPLRTDACSWLAPQFCSNVQAFLSIVGRQDSAEQFDDANDDISARENLLYMARLNRIPEDEARRRTAQVVDGFDSGTMRRRQDSRLVSSANKPQYLASR
ncbi:MAG: substrate-binding domain-containing protein, partial [Rhizobiales bacterium]|nr:substrate-binding domain-containing protein [Hyphomicrobiales bacterium]